MVKLIFGDCFWIPFLLCRAQCGKWGKEDQAARHLEISQEWLMKVI